MAGKTIQPVPSSLLSSNVSDNKTDQERFLPIANVSRIMKKSLPSNAKISKDAKETVQECVSEFISFVTGEASDKCQRERRKTINGDDLLWAMTTLGFENYVGTLKDYLSKYRETDGDKSNMTTFSPTDDVHEHVEIVTAAPTPKANNSQHSINGDYLLSIGSNFGSSEIDNSYGFGLNVRY